MKTIYELEPNDCRYVCDDEFNFCAKPQYIYLLNGKMKQSSYCKKHHHLCVRPYVEQKERDEQNRRAAA